MTVFLDNAPLYWAANIPVIPLKPRQKMPILNEWTTYGSVMPSEGIRAHWLASYPNSNIGLPFGPASGLCAIDIDSIDPEVNEILDEVLPPSPWTRVGKKGRGLIFRWQGQKNFKVQSQDDGMLVEFLGLGNQLVLPPSIHPDTGQPYVSNTNLWEVMDQIHTLPADIEERIRLALGVKGVTLAHSGRSGPLDVVPEGARDIQMTRYAGYLARVVRGIDKSEKWTLHAALEQMATWVREFTSRVAGDAMDPAKGMAKLLEFLLQDIEGGATLPEGWEIGLTEVELAHPTIITIKEKNEVARWTFSKARDWLKSSIDKDPGNDDHFLRVVDELITLVAKDENFTEFDFSVLRSEIVARGGKDMGISKPELSKMFKVARKGDTELAMDHETIARQEIEQISRDGELRWHQGYFWQWDGACFTQLHDDWIYKHIAENVKGSLLVKKGADYKSMVDTIRKLCKHGLDEAEEPGVNFANGFLDQGLVLHDHAMKWGKTFTMSFNYVPARASEAHKRLSFLERCWGSDIDYQDKVKALQEAFAATMFGRAFKYQRAILLFGMAGSGKTQALDVLRAMMPPIAVSAIPPHMWGERFQLSGMVSKALNVCGELPEGATIGGDIFKRVVEGGLINTEMKMKDAFEYQPIAAQWFASNHLPFSKDSSSGFARRWLILEFNRAVPPGERIPNYAEILVAEEREAIAAWAMEGLKRLQEKNDYTEPASHLSRLDAVRMVNNSVVAFLRQAKTVRLTGNMEDTVESTVVYDDYKLYMRDYARNNSVGFSRFTEMITEIGVAVDDEVEADTGVVVSVMKGVKSTRK